MVSEPEGSLSVTKPMVEEGIKVAINPKHPDQTVMIGSTLTEEGRNRQKKRGQAADRIQAIHEEVGKLVEAGIIKEEPPVLVTCRSRLSLIKTIREQISSTPWEALFRKTCFVWFLDLDDWSKNCVIIHLMLEYWDDYNNEDDPIPFRRRVFSSAKDGLEDRRRVPDWILRLENDRDSWDKYPWGLYVWLTMYYQLRDANVTRCPSLYATEPKKDVDHKAYSVFGFIWAFKTWILESFRVGANDYYTRYRRYPRVVAWRSKRKFYRHMLHGFFHDRIEDRTDPDWTVPFRFGSIVDDTPNCEGLAQNSIQ
uniref:Phospholipase-like protein n=1 Tax=Tanacetum cinerariifolium TaxID=118510 RepID=A0A6L2KA75_TANCI|nr:phospholipase-like protein [Tanacetum cinerariifolium]